MTRILSFVAAALAVPVLALPAQYPLGGSARQQGDTASGRDTASAAGAIGSQLEPQIIMQHFRPADQRGLNVFEAPKEAGVPFTGFRLAWGAAFRQQFQGLEHTNTAVPVIVGGVNRNELIDIGRGFNLATANLNLHMQLADGIRVALTSYMSSRHHTEFWVKDGYALIDKSPIDNPVLNDIMKYTTLKLGHFEINYGDQHFRRSDNGNAMYNPFVGNLIIDAFTTEVGGELYVRNNGWLAMAGLTSGTIQGGVTNPADRSNAYLGKLGYDWSIVPELRFRLTGSYYKNDKSPSNTLLTGDRAGSPYYLVMENAEASTRSQAWSGAIRPNLRNSVRAYGFNPFIKVLGLEFFGTYDNFRGKTFSEPDWRDWNQYAGDLVYRFRNDKLYVGARANTAKGDLGGIPSEVSVDRYATSAGWFVTPVMLLKGEFMQQKYHGFPSTDLRNGGKIQGFVVEGVVSF